MLPENVHDWIASVTVGTALGYLSISKNIAKTGPAAEKTEQIMNLGRRQTLTCLLSPLISAEYSTTSLAFNAWLA